MSSWLISLQQYGLVSSDIADDVGGVGPRWRIAETAAQIVEHIGDLAVAHAVGKAGHDRAAFAGGGTNARQHDIGGVASVGAGEGSRERQIDSAKRRCPVG